MLKRRLSRLRFGKEIGKDSTTIPVTAGTAAGLPLGVVPLLSPLLSPSSSTTNPLTTRWRTGRRWGARQRARRRHASTIECWLASVPRPIPHSTHIQLRNAQVSSFVTLVCPRPPVSLPMSFSVDPPFHISNLTKRDTESCVRKKHRFY